jgi:hypothetical protein
VGKYQEGLKLVLKVAMSIKLSKFNHISRIYSLPCVYQLVG